MTLLMLGSTVLAQQPQTWLMYFGRSDFKNSKFGIHHELQYRDHQAFGDLNQILARVGGRYQFTDWFAGTLGYGFVHNEAAGSPDYPFSEHRIYQEGAFFHALFQKAKLQHRLRLEERFVENSDFLGRFRYCLFVDIPITNRTFDAGGWYIQAFDEMFINISSSEMIDPFDRNRAYLGLGYKVTKNLGVQLGYMRQNVGEQAGTNHAMLSLHQQVKW